MAAGTLPGSTDKNPVDVARLAGNQGMPEIQRKISLVMIKFRSEIKRCRAARIRAAQHKEND